MSTLDHFLAKKILGAEPTKPDIDLDTVSKEPIPSAPEKVLQDKLPTGFGKDFDKEQIESEKFPEVKTKNPELAETGEYIALLARELRDFEGKLEAIKKEHKAVLNELKASEGYDAKLKELESLMQDFGNGIIAEMAALGNTSRALFKLDNHLIAVSRELQETEKKPSEYEALVQILTSSFDKDIVDQLIKDKEELVKQQTEVIYKLRRAVTLVPKLKHHTRTPTSIKIGQILIKFAQVADGLTEEIANVLEKMNEFILKLWKLDTQFEHLLPEDKENVEKVDFTPAEEKPIAASKNDKSVEGTK